MKNGNQPDETALFETYTHGPHLQPGQWKYLFSLADRSKLIACGDSIPEGPQEVYRGIRDRKHRKWIRGLSWTTNPSTAAWFATRFSSANEQPAVYSLTVTPSQILFAANDRAEQEVVVMSWECGRVKRLAVMPDAIKPKHGISKPIDSKEGRHETDR